MAAAVAIEKIPVVEVEKAKARANRTRLEAERKAEAMAKQKAAAEMAGAMAKAADADRKAAAPLKAQQKAVQEENEATTKAVMARKAAVVVSAEEITPEEVATLRAPSPEKAEARAVWQRAKWAAQRAEERLARDPEDQASRDLVTERWKEAAARKAEYDAIAGSLPKVSGLQKAEAKVSDLRDRLAKAEAELEALRKAE